LEGSDDSAVSDNCTVSVAQAQSAWYRSALAAEVAVGRGLREEDLAELRINHPVLLRYKARILGDGDVFREYADWTRFVLRAYGPRRKCLSLGSGVGRVERFLITNGFTHQFETIELNPYLNVVARGQHSGIRPQGGDLNFLRLPEETYDFILCHGVLHHLINLEHVLFQVNRALKADGILLIYEYIGETRWQFTLQRMSTLKDALPEWRYRVPRPWEIRGFEAVRSSEVLPVIEQQFGKGEPQVSYGGIYFPFVICTAADADRDLHRVVQLDEEFSRAGTVAPCYLMGVYRKSDLPPVAANPWSDKEVEEYLAPALPLRVRLRAIVAASPLAPYVKAARRIVARDRGRRPC
jgi:SAM-dependent methyltransferase